MSRSVFQSHFDSHKNFIASQVQNNFVEVDCLVLDLIGYENNYTSIYLENKEYKDNLYFVVAISYSKEIVAMPLKHMSYDELRANYGSDSNIIGREVLIKARSLRTEDIINGRLVFKSGFNNKVALQDDNAVNIPVSMGGMAGLEYRGEDRMFYNKNIAARPGNVWGELRPL